MQADRLQVARNWLPIKICCFSKKRKGNNSTILGLKSQKTAENLFKKATFPSYSTKDLFSLNPASTWSNLGSMSMVPKVNSSFQNKLNRTKAVRAQNNSKRLITCFFRSFRALAHHPEHLKLTGEKTSWWVIQGEYFEN